MQGHASRRAGAIRIILGMGSADRIVREILGGIALRRKADSV
jgi:hypothetical protein